MKALLSLAACVAVFLLTWAQSAHAATLTATPATLDAVLAQAQGGDTVVLGAQAYPGPILLRDRAFAPPLTLDARGATVTNGAFRNVSGVRVIGGTWLNGCTTFPCYKVALAFYGGGGVAVMDARAIGPEESRPGFMAVAADGAGLRFDGVSGAEVSGSSFAGFKTGLTFSETSDFKAIGNHFTRMRSDGIDVALSRRGLIEGNVCDATRILTVEHPDCVQMWSRPTAPPTADITIRRNKAVGETQCFSGFNHVRDGVDDGGFDRITVEGNICAGGDPQGIGLYAVRGLVLKNNTVSTLAGSEFQTKINLGPDTTVTLRCGNVVEPGAGRKGVVDPPCPVP